MVKCMMKWPRFGLIIGVPICFGFIFCCAGIDQWPDCAQCVWGKNDLVLFLFVIE